MKPPKFNVGRFLRKEEIIKNPPSSCMECEKRPNCTTPCRMVDDWANQDHIGGNSKILLANSDISTISSTPDDFVDLCRFHRKNFVEKDSNTSMEAWHKIMDMKLSHKVSRFIYSYYYHGRRIRDIAIEEGVSSQAIDRRHHQAKKTVRRNLDAEENWKTLCNELKLGKKRPIKEYDIVYMVIRKLFSKKQTAKLLRVHVDTVDSVLRRVIP